MTKQFRKLKHRICTAAVALLAAAVMNAQTTSGTLVGTVADSSGGVVSGASVTITNEGTGAVRRIDTGADGHYSATLLPGGSYSVEVVKPGFKKSKVSGVVLEVNQAARTDVTLDVGATNQTVEVSSEATIVQTDRSDVGHVVGAKQAVELPLNGRNFIQLATLAPGTMSAQKADGVLNAHGGGIVVNGASTNANQITLDGVENQDFLIPRVGVHPSPDAIAEFKVMGATYSAEFGRGAGANINVVIKSGTNDLHGTAFWFHRNDNLDARNFFDGPKLPEFKRNQFGGTLGG
ncbi:MAG: carboxypeptidase-like regulatory domain-containing protein, partial [Bryobacteraceae bacterium]